MSAALLILLLGCDPQAEHVEAESVWYDADRIAAEAGVSLVEVPDGEPVGYWTRVVVRMDGIDLDDRAWILTRPPEIFEAEVGGAGVAPTVLPGLVPMEGGRVSGAAKRGLLIPALYDAMSDLADAHAEIADRASPPDTGPSSSAAAPRGDVGFRGRFVIVPEPGVPWSTLREVIYTAAQARFDAAAIAGRVSIDGGPDRLRFPGASSGPCAAQASVVLGPSRGWFTLSGATSPPLTGPGGCADDGGLAAALTSLVASCRPHWSAAFERAGEALDEEALCASTMLSPESALTAEALLAFQAELYQAWPAVHQGPLAGGLDDAERCDHAVPVASLSPAQLEYVCGGDALESTLREPAGLLSRRGALATGFDGASPELSTLFPQYAAALDEARQPAGAGISSALLGLLDDGQEGDALDVAEGAP